MPPHSDLLNSPGHIGLGDQSRKGLWRSIYVSHLSDEKIKARHAESKDLPKLT